ncbi:hypothetical protein FCV25MIE_24798 [Fagus crenata]
MGSDISRVMLESCSRVWDCSRMLWTRAVCDIGSRFWVGLGVAWASCGEGEWAWIDVSSGGPFVGEAGTRCGTVQGPEGRMDCTIARV